MFWRYTISLTLFLICIVVKNPVFCNDNCWKSYDAAQHFDVMDKLDEKYAVVKNNYNEMVQRSNFDNIMLDSLLENRGKAVRAIHAAKGDENLIPAGINLGGYCMMVMPKSLLFFHRMKLRNNTVFRVASLRSDLADLKTTAHILMNDLHLFGSYDFSYILDKPNVLSYSPTFGQVELLLKNVSYKMEGRYRLLKNRLNIEQIISEIDIQDILMMYRNKDSSDSVALQRKNIDVFVARLKVDLDRWLKDYFNDFLMYYVVAEDPEFEKYNQAKTMALNHYADKAIEKVLERLNEIKANAVHIPPFQMHSLNIATVSLRDGVLRGLDSIYRRSVSTGTKQNNVRTVSAVVGFSNLKLSYRYNAVLRSGLPPVTGVLTLTADDLTAFMTLSLTKDPETVDLSFTFLEQAKPESLTIEGPVNRMISNFKHMLERHIIALMTNTLMHNVDMLGTIDRCVPILAPYKEADVNNSYVGIETPETGNSYTKTDEHNFTTTVEDITRDVEKIDELEPTETSTQETKEISEENVDKPELTEAPSQERKEIGEDTNSDEIEVSFPATNKGPSPSQELYEDEKEKDIGVQRYTPSFVAENYRRHSINSGAVHYKNIYN